MKKNITITAVNNEFCQTKKHHAHPVNLMKIIVQTIILIFCMSGATAQTIRYVKPNGTGNGSSWANASGSIQDMIDYTNPGGRIWVAPELIILQRL